MIESWLASIVLECTKSSAIDWAKEAPALLVIFFVDSPLTCIGAVAWICGSIVHRILLCVWTFQNTTLYGNHLLRTVLRPIFAAHHRPVIVSPNNLARRSLCINLEIIHGFFLNFPPNPPGGYSQWQSQTITRREGKCRAPETTNFTCMITRTKIGFTDRPQNIQNFENTILPIQKYCTSDLVLHYSSRLLGCKQKYWIKLLLYRLEVSSWVVNDASPIMMCKEPEQKRIDTCIEHTT